LTAACAAYQYSKGEAGRPPSGPAADHEHGRIGLGGDCGTARTDRHEEHRPGRRNELPVADREVGAAPCHEIELLVSACSGRGLVVGLDQGVARPVCRVPIDAERGHTERSPDWSPDETLVLDPLEGLEVGVRERSVSRSGRVHAAFELGSK